MAKRTNNRAWWTAFVLLALGCGGRAEEQRNAGVSGAAGSEAASGSSGIAGAGSSAAGSPSVEVGSTAGAGSGGSPPGVGPIDTTGLPTELPMDCVGPMSLPRLVLPCKVGMGPLYALECYDSGGGTAVTGSIQFPTLYTLLNQPVEIPSASFPSEPTYGEVTVDGVRYRGVLHGTAVFSQIDPIGRAFVATLTGGRITWTGINDQTLAFTCTIPSTPFWAVAGNFL